MRKILFRDTVINIVIGIIFIVFAIVSYFLDWFEDGLNIIIGALIIMISMKRFVYAFKKEINKYTSLILIVELLLDLLLSGLLIYYNSHTTLYIGLVFYIRGLSYLLIRYITKARVKLVPYLASIMYLTIAGFLFFTTIDVMRYMTYGLFGALVFLGLLYFLQGIYLLKTNKQSLRDKKNDKIGINQELSEEKPRKPEKNIRMNPNIRTYQDMTVPELKELLRKKGHRQLYKYRKQELIDMLKEKHY